MDTTLRDAHQSLWATRMTTAMTLPVAPGLGPKSVRELIALANQNRRPDPPYRVDADSCTMHFQQKKGTP